MATSTSGEIPDELQTCAGIGWVKVDNAVHGGGAGGSAAQAPAVRCVGLRLSQPVGPPVAPSGSHGGGSTNSAGWSSSGSPPTAAAPAAPRGRSLGVGGTSGAGETVGAPAPAAGATPLVKVDEPNWALVCAGQLSLIVRSAVASSGSDPRNGSGAAASANGEGSSAAGAPWVVRCDGLSIRMERITVGNSSSHGAGAAGGSSSSSSSSSSSGSSSSSSSSSERQPNQQQHHGAPQSAEAPPRGVASSPGNSPEGGAWPSWPLAPPSVLPPGAVEAFRAAARGAEAVADRASTILVSVGGAANETAGPVRFLSNTFGASVKICTQAGKIVCRSVEQVGRLASLPIRLRDGGFGGGGGGGQEPRPGGG